MNTTANSRILVKTARMSLRLLLQHHAYLKKSKSRGCLSAFGTGFGTPKGVPRFNSLTYQRKAGGIDAGHPGPRPAGALRASKIAPGDFVEPGSSTHAPPPK